MVIFWIFAALVSLSAFGYGMILMQWGLVGSLLFALAVLIFCRGLITWMRRSLILRERIADDEDTNKRTLETNRYIFWRRITFLGVALGLYLSGSFFLLGLSPAETLLGLPGLLAQGLVVVAQFGLLFVAQFMIFFGPFILFGRMGRQTLVPGDANYEVKMEDVRGQKSAVSEMQRILRLIEHGRNYVRAGGKRERGVLMVGPPGTGKTMLAKGIASTLHSPIIITSGAAFSGMFIGMDMVAVWMMVRAAKRKAKRWGGCTIFIDEFDALGQRRAGMGGGGGGGMGGMGGMFGGGQMGLNMLLVQMDGVDNPGLMKKFFRRAVNVTLDGLFVPREIRINGSRASLRVPHLKPPRTNLFFIGATNRPQVLDEAVTRPGRFGRTITFRMPTREGRKDIAELYFDVKAHDPELDSPSRREEVARITEGYSPAMIEQALSLALMYAFEDGRTFFRWQDLREAMGNIESGLAEPVEYSERDKVAVARHELGHAVAAHFFEPDKSSVRLSIRMRSGSLGHHYNIDKEEQFVEFRSQSAGRLRAILGALSAERVFYGENSSGVTMDLIQSTRLACLMIGVWGMGPDQLNPELSRKAANMGEYLISRAEEVGDSALGRSTVNGSILSGSSRRVVAQVMGAAFIDDWRLMYANRESIDTAAEALMAQGELVGDEVDGLLESVGLRPPDASVPYPEDAQLVPPARDGEEERPRMLDTA
ncbi:MAG: AAA family ATPase [Candidatus Dormibacteraeota bacterium]|jgi:ATP-dependent Zn protease|nr:AAA family ATPase [Candidatus Dormibacteraeota bacterium]